MLMQAAKCVAELMEHDTGIFGIVGIVAQPAEVHGGLV
jgi:hypothetical protein